MTGAGPTFAQAADLFGAQRHAEAAGLCRKIVASSPTHADALNLIGAVEAIRRRYEAAALWFSATLALDGRRIDGHSNLGSALVAAGHPGRALRSFRSGVAVDPRSPELWRKYAVALQTLERYPEAVAGLSRILALDRDIDEIHSDLGVIQAAMGDFGRAARRFRMALALAPGRDRALNELGNVLMAARRTQEAHLPLARMVTVSPMSAETHNNLAICLQGLNRGGPAAAEYRKAIAIEPSAPDPYSNLSACLQGMTRYEEAIASCRRSQAIVADHADSHWNEALASLCLGDFATGWAKFEYRRFQREARRHRSFGPGLWLGDADVVGKTLLLHAEHGLGDTIQFSRFAPIVARTGAKLILAVPATLVRLLSFLRHQAKVVDIDRPLPAYERHCPLPSLPFALGTTLRSIPGPVQPPPASDRKAAVAWRDRLAGGEPARVRRTPRLVGIAWSGRRDHANDRNRSISLEAWRPLLRQPRVSFVSLQKDIRDEDRTTMRDIGLRGLESSIEDFMDTAAALQQLDLVITVDTSLAHLAGMLMRPVWVLVPYAPDWRWLLDRSDSPWYPTARLFRQDSIGSWDQVIDDVRRALKATIG
jgi:tetratricopeptide (TPR) repeat protein